MSSLFNYLKVPAVAILFSALMACGNALGQSSSNQQSDPALGSTRKGFVSSTGKVNGTTLHFV
jgi:hypothetical protein